MEKKKKKKRSRIEKELNNRKNHDLEELKEEFKKELEQRDYQKNSEIKIEEKQEEHNSIEKKETESNSKQESKKTSKSKRAKRTKKISIKKVILRIIQVILMAILIFSGLEILKWHGDNQKTQELLEDIATAVTQVENEDGGFETFIDFDKLKSMNSDTVAWIKVNNTNVEYPIVKTKDNEYYLTHNFDKSNSKAGWIFADYRNKVDGTDRNLIIYGHNRMDGSMFASLENTLEEGWYTNPENKAIKFITENEEYIYEIFSIYDVVDEEYYIRTEFSSDEAYQNFLNTLKNRSIYDFNEEVTSEDQILTLSTCTNYNNGRIVIHAKKIRNDSEIIIEEPEEIN